MTDRIVSIQEYFICPECRKKNVLENLSEDGCICKDCFDYKQEIEESNTIKQGGEK